MSEAKHTKGPWKVTRDRGDHWGMVEVEGPGVGGRIVIGFTVATDVDFERARTIVADAALISAAPDLLAACETALKCLIDLAPYPPEVTEGVVGITAVVHAAIQKARGTP